MQLVPFGQRRFRLIDQFVDRRIDVLSKNVVLHSREKQGRVIDLLASPV